MVLWRCKHTRKILLASFLLGGQAFSPNGCVRPGGTRPVIASPVKKPWGACILGNSYCERKTAVFLASPSSALPLLGSFVSKVGHGRLLVATLAALALYRYRMRLFWPGVAADPSFQEPLPPGRLGCPFLGVNFIQGSSRLGPEFQFRLCSSRLDDPRVWMSFFLGSPVAVVSGTELVTAVNNMEFKLTGSGSERRNQQNRNKPKVFGTNNLMFERDKDQHAFLRRLVGAAMTPEALSRALPTIQRAAAETISDMLEHVRKYNDPIKMENVCVDYTMDIVQRQLLGLKLKTEEVVVFREKLKVWLQAMYSIIGTLNISWLVKRSAPYKAKKYIVSKLEEKVDSLLANGPDVSTLSNMVFAVDDEGGSAKLSREQILENAQLLVIAGSETSAGTLALAMLLLGLHPNKYHKLVKEQVKLIEEHGSNLTQTMLDKECPYLDAVVKEALRIGPVTTGFPRTTKKTIIVNGTQIPKDWAIMTSYRLTHQLDPMTGDAMEPTTGFEPERWLHPDTIPTEWIPFGAGPRYCLGKHLAMMEMKVFLAELARRVSSFELVNYTPGNNQSIQWNPATIVPRSADGVLIHALQEISGT